MIYNQQDMADPRRNPRTKEEFSQYLEKALGTSTDQLDQLTDDQILNLLDKLSLDQLGKMLALTKQRLRKIVQ